MITRNPARLLSIGEFAAATQLSPKALRLYDEHRLLPPAHIDAENGYRYYRADQVGLGRLIRTLRDMDLSLMDIASIVAVQDVGAETMLTQFARELDRRYAREKRAFQAALVLLRRATTSDSPEIVIRERVAVTVAVRAFMADRHQFVERFRREADASRTALARVGMIAAGAAYCGLIDPLSDEEGRLEVLMPVTAPAEIPDGICLRQLSAALCAAVVADARETHASELAGALDALFDWFDRHGHRAIESPLVSIHAGETGLHTQIMWAYEPALIPPR